MFCIVCFCLFVVCVFFLSFFFVKNENEMSVRTAEKTSMPHAQKLPAAQPERPA